MTWLVTVDNEQIMLSSDALYDGGEKPSSEERLIRKAVGLPVTKQLVYYKDTLNPNSVVNVQSYKLIEMYQITERWFVVEVNIENEDTKRIHSTFLAEMQKPSFVADMKAQQEKNGE